MPNQKIFAVHQPNYLPWLGYFYKMNRCDVFVYLDDVQFPRGRSFANRNRIKTPNGEVYLNIPIKHSHGHHGKLKYTEIEFAADNWKAKHLKTLEMNYKRAPHFEEIFARYESALLPGGNLVEVNIRLIETFADYLEITSQRVRLSEMSGEFGQKSDLIAAIGQALGANVYLSGEGARDYNDEELLRQRGIRLAYAAFAHPVYPQLWGEFVPQLSILDVLFNCGPGTKAFL